MSNCNTRDLRKLQVKQTWLAAVKSPQIWKCTNYRRRRRLNQTSVTWGGTWTSTRREVWHSGKTSWHNHRFCGHSFDSGLFTYTVQNSFSVKEIRFLEHAMSLLAAWNIFHGYEWLQPKSHKSSQVTYDYKSCLLHDKVWQSWAQDIVSSFKPAFLCIYFSYFFKSSSNLQLHNCQ